MVRPGAIRVSLGAFAFLCLAGCYDQSTSLDVVDPVTGCCVFRKFETAAQASRFLPCTCTCDGGSCHEDQPIGADGTSGFACFPERVRQFNVDLGCETRR